MNFRQKFTLHLLIFIALCGVAVAQTVDILDNNLHRAIRDALRLPPDAPITRTNILRLEKLEAPSARITSLQGLEAATNLVYLDIGGNPLSELAPLARLPRLVRLFAWECRIDDITPISNLTTLKYLDLSVNRIVDISALADLTNLVELSLGKNYIRDIRPLTNMTKLKYLNVYANKIPDVSPLSGLSNLEFLYLDQNKTADHNALDGLSLVDFTYDSICDMPSLPLTERLDNRTFPSIFTYWGHIVNKPHLAPDVGYTENIAMHDLICCFDHQLVFLNAPAGIRMGGLLEDAIRQRDELLALNPNMIFIIVVKMQNAFFGDFPEDSPYWIRDEHGNIAMLDEVSRLVNFTHPEVQDIIVEQAVAVSKCGLFDGIFFDYWHDNAAILHDGGSFTYVGLAAEQRARDNIIQRIRAETRPDFLIMGNANDNIMPRTGQYLNGSFMENGGNSPKAEDSLQWLENNLRSPQINALQGNSLLTEAPDSPNNLRRMRAATTLSLTLSNGYSVFVIGSGDDHYWYDFWDAGLGRPVGPTSQLYDEDIPGLYIREFTNGWAASNHSGDQQVITLPEEVQGVASGFLHTEHTLPNLDGEMYLRVKPKNPADVNGDGTVNVLDLALVAQAFGRDGLDADVNGDGVVNVFDLVFVANQF